MSTNNIDELRKIIATAPKNTTYIDSGARSGGRVLTRSLADITTIIEQADKLETLGNRVKTLECTDFEENVMLQGLLDESNEQIETARETTIEQSDKIAEQANTIAELEKRIENLAESHRRFSQGCD
jgi:septal ring factor EnvC (AmiA/AmiB activator)